MSVREIRGWTPATALPHAPAYVRGVINLRGSVLPIVDLAAAPRLSRRPTPSARHVIIVVQVGAQIVGLLVDAVSDILTLTTDERSSRRRTSPPTSSSRSSAACWRSTAG